MGSHQKQNEKNFTLFVSYCGRGQQILVGEPWRKGFFGGLVRVKKQTFFGQLDFWHSNVVKIFVKLAEGVGGGLIFL